MANFKPPEEITGDELTDVSLEDISQSLFRVTKDLRALTQVANRIILWETTSNENIVPPTVAKRGHHPMLRILIQQARDYEALCKLERDAEDTGAELGDRINLAKAKQKALSDARDTSLQVQRLSLDSIKAADAALGRMASLTQAYRIHKEKMRSDVMNISPAELDAKLAALEKAL